MKIVNAEKMTKEHISPASQFKELAKGMKTKTPNSHIRMAARKV